MSLTCTCSEVYLPSVGVEWASPEILAQHVPLRADHEIFGSVIEPVAKHQDGEVMNLILARPENPDRLIVSDKAVIGIQGVMLSERGHGPN